jgi:2-polyprenyl-3-methyl-5-hydroxy-6-metoxy-1,4-benzoquinol methylase
MALREDKLSSALLLERRADASGGDSVGTLTEKQYWDSTHLTECDSWQSARCMNDAGEKAARGRSLKRWVKSLLGERLLAYMGSYENYLLWEVIYKKYLPRRVGAKVLEVGSAPGDYLVKVAEKYSFVPYGIEYSESGVELNRRIFADHNIDPDQVIQADFLSPEIHSRYRGAFDIVVSRGFIEHFTNVREIIEKHLSLLAEGGHLIISVPNLSGVNYMLAQLFHKEVIPLHNLSIMDKREFFKLFDRAGLSPLFCDYYGTFNFGLFNTAPRSPMVRVLNTCMKAQLVLNATFRLFFPGGGLESRMFSPSLIYIGVKRGEGISAETTSAPDGSVGDDF